MSTAAHLSPDAIRALFAHALSDMYRAEVPQYGTLLELVSDINRTRQAAQGQAGAGQRLDVERHGAIRLGAARELHTMRRLFGVMGMSPVGYYDLSAAGLPVHATAFRPVENASLALNPFRVFTSLLRLELIEDQALRSRAQDILARRSIFTSRCIELIEQAEREGGLGEPDAAEFVAQALETFRWHSEATVDLETYQQLRAAHPLIADVVCFKGPHINHLTPRVLDIDEAQAEMNRRQMRVKATIEGPPRRAVPILLRQTSFLALEESIAFVSDQGEKSPGTHTARFGEIEQRGCALTPKGRALYDRLLAEARASEAPDALRAAFQAFPDDLHTLYRQGLIYVTYQAGARARDEAPVDADDIQALVDGRWLEVAPLVYEDFLPVSAAGIFQSNLGTQGPGAFADGGSRDAFEAALGAPVCGEFALYEKCQADSLAAALAALGFRQDQGQPA
jgi:uncharacterized glyoxalase superfamily metalloenzyme YdcJ